MTRGDGVSGWRAAIEEMLRIHPRCLATMPGRTSWARWSGARTWTSSMAAALRGELGDRQEVGDGCVVHEHVDRTRRGRGLLDEPLALVGPRDVRGDRDRAATRRTDPVRGLVDRALEHASAGLRGSRGDDDDRARASEALCDRSTDPPAARSRARRAVECCCLPHLHLAARDGTSCRHRRTQRTRRGRTTKDERRHVVPAAPGATPLRERPLDGRRVAARRP